MVQIPSRLRRTPHPRPSSSVIQPTSGSEFSRTEFRPHLSLGGVYLLYPDLYISLKSSQESRTALDLFARAWAGRGECEVTWWEFRVEDLLRTLSRPKWILQNSPLKNRAVRCTRRVRHVLSQHQRVCHIQTPTPNSEAFFVVPARKRHPTPAMIHQRLSTSDDAAPATQAPSASGPSFNAEGPRPNVPAASEHQTSSVPPGAPIIKTAPSRKLITASFDVDTVDLSDDEALDNLNTVPLREVDPVLGNWPIFPCHLLDNGSPYVAVDKRTAISPVYFNVYLVYTSPPGQTLVHWILAG
ncbi:hypothetical protein B0H11DRAFT_1919944 [Mycena galericulata]|nr:hypothetical protein B0H11DRAFT_1919944 [Mycena galericulata]